MGELPPSSTGQTLRAPVPRDPPPPPGYVDPLDGNSALDALVPVDLPGDDDELSTGTSEQPPATT